MHASIVTFQLPPEHLDRAIAGVKENTRNIHDNPGFQQGYWVYDRNRGQMTAVVVFDTAEQASAAWEKARPQVIDGLKPLGITPDAGDGEVVHHAS